MNSIVQKAGPLTRTELFENDAKNTFTFPMTSPGKLNEVEQKIMREKKPEANNKSNDWKSMESFNVGLGRVQTLKANQ